MNNGERAQPGRAARDLDLASMSRERLEALAALVEREIDARTFEENLKRELDSHSRKQQWVASHSTNGGRGRRRY
jgi:hypothetical protein